ncbi:hypothetical protein M8J75_011200 [Diaphorina citri]|nr:hypothetical protein M8J75_011200 [Diaphorina citri]
MRPSAGGSPLKMAWCRHLRPRFNLAFTALHPWSKIKWKGRKVTPDQVVPLLRRVKVSHRVWDSLGIVPAVNSEYAHSYSGIPRTHFYQSCI